jgi:hypothetical protein
MRSIERVLGEGEVVRDAAYLWSRHRWVVPYGAFVFAMLVLVAPFAGIDDWPTRVVSGLAGIAVAVTATSEYRVVALTSHGLVLLRASKIRQVATGPAEDLGPDDEMAPVGGTVLASEWQVGDRRYTVPRSSEQAMHRMAAARAADP